MLQQAVAGPLSKLGNRCECHGSLDMTIIKVSQKVYQVKEALVLKGNESREGLYVKMCSPLFKWDENICFIILSCQIVDSDSLRDI